MQRVGERIGNELLFKEPITVGVTFGDGDGLGGVPDYNVAYTAARKYGDENNPILYYPQALFKQTRHSAILNQSALSENVKILPNELQEQIHSFAEAKDLEFRLGSLNRPEHMQHWNLLPETMPNLLDRHFIDLIDLELVASQIITHALGFSSNIRKYIHGAQTKCAPELYFNENTGFSHFGRITPFDSFIMSSPIQRPGLQIDIRQEQDTTSHSVLEMAQKFDEFPGAFMSQEDYLTSMLRNQYFIQAANALCGNLTDLIPKSAQFDGNTVDMEGHFDPNVDGFMADFGHRFRKFPYYHQLASRYGNSPDFLLVRLWTSAAESLHSLMVANNITAIFGPEMMKVFEHIGYATRRKPRFADLEFHSR